jgi:hypothetical protein
MTHRHPALRVAIAALAALACGTAFASVTYDPSTGAGFVGKGDVQTAFGWNNATLQKNAGSVTFTYATKATYDVTCEWNTYTNGNVNHEVKTIHHENTEGLTIASTAVFASSTRTNRNGDVTGFNLLGYAGVAPSGGDVPVVGDATFCNAHDMGPLENPQTDSHDGSYVTQVTLVEGSESAGLFVNYGDQSVPLPY